MMGNKAIHGGGKPTKQSVSLGIEDDELDERRRRLAPFHPGPGAHEWQGHMLAHAHCKLLIEAITIIEHEAKAILISHGWSTAHVLQEQMDSLMENLNNHKEGYLTSKPLAKPIGCHEEYCLSKSSQCFTSYSPHGPTSGIEKLIKGPSLYNPFPVTLGTATPSPPGELEPKDKWKFAMPPAMSYKEHASYGYLDFKVALKGDRNSGKLEFEITTTLAKSPIVVCQPQCPWGKCKADQRLLNDEKSVRWTLDGQVKKPPDVSSLPKHDVSFDKPGTCLVVAYTKTAGKHTLGVEALGGTPTTSYDPYRGM